MQSTILFNDQKIENTTTTTTTQLQQQIEFEEPQQLLQLFECRIDNSNNNLNG